MTTVKPSVLFVCVHNAGRSQMAAGYLQALAGDRVEVFSAGSAPKDQINHIAVEAMKEDGIDISAPVISGNTITLLSDNYVGFLIVVTYRTNAGDAYAVARPFLGSLSGERDNSGGYSPGGLEEATATDPAPWTAQHLGCGIPRLHVSVSYDETIYASGLPNISAIVRGKKVYDPRLDTTVGGLGAHRVNDPSTWTWSRNSALCAADYLMDELGFGVLPSEINWEAVAVAAYTCDDWLLVTAAKAINSVTKAVNGQVQSMTLHGLNVGDNVQFSSMAGMVQLNTVTATVTKVVSPTVFEIDVNTTALGTFTSGNYAKRQRRFTCDGVLSTEADRKANLEQLLGSLGGDHRAPIAARSSAENSASWAT